MELKMWLPKDNLGCLGFKIGKTYFDFFRLWNGRIQMFISSVWIYRLGLSDNGKGYLSLKGWKPMR